MQSVSVDGSETNRCVCEMYAIAAPYYNLRHRLSASERLVVVFSRVFAKSFRNQSSLYLTFSNPYISKLYTRRAPIALRPGGAVTGVKVPLALCPPSSGV